MTSFLQTWAEGADVNRTPGEPLEHTASDVFRKRDVLPGDRIFVAEVVDRRLHLVGRMRVAELVDAATAETKLHSTDLWDARDHLIAEPGSATQKVFNRQVPDNVARSLRFLQKTGRRGPGGRAAYARTTLKFDSAGGLDGQTTRTVRRLTEDSAEQLEQLL